MFVSGRVSLFVSLLLLLVACSDSDPTPPQTPLIIGPASQTSGNLSVRVDKVLLDATGGDTFGPSEVYFELMVIRRDGKSVRVKYPGNGTFSNAGLDDINLNDFSLTINQIRPDETVLLYFLAFEEDELSLVEEASVSAAMDGTMELLEQKLTEDGGEALAKQLGRGASLATFVVTTVAGVALEWWQQADLLGDYAVLLTPENNWLIQQRTWTGQNPASNMVVYFSFLADLPVVSITQTSITQTNTPPALPTATDTRRPITAPTTTPRPTTPRPTPTPKSPYVVNFTLINAITNQSVPGYNPMADGAVIDLSDLNASNLDIRANTYPGLVGSVSFTLNPGGYSWHENESPYALMHDLDGDYSHIPWLPAPGTYTLTAIPYTSKDLGGEQGAGLTIRFTVRQ